MASRIEELREEVLGLLRLDESSKARQLVHKIETTNPDNLKSKREIQRFEQHLIQIKRYYGIGDPTTLLS